MEEGIMTVNLISYSQAHKDFDSAETLKNIQDLVAFCARVSNPANQMSTETADKLINYLIRNKHWSPFEMVNVCLEIVTTRDIARQMLRHRSFSFQEFSQRYANPVEDHSGLEFTIREARLQDSKNRQNSIPIDEQDIENKYIALQWDRKQKELLTWVEEQYRWAINNGIAKEQARCILPEGLTASRLYMNGTLRSWIHYIELRSDNGTQLEHQLIAKDCAREIAKIFPLLYNIKTT
jgi:thymidylate synthase (FAD)